MEKLQQRVKEDGVVIDGGILKVDSFLNHQIDPELMYEVGETIYNKYKDEGITKVLTIEASGIAPAIMTALKFKVPCLFAKKSVPSTLTEEVYHTDIHSYTKNKTSHVVVSKRFLNENDRVVIIDDFLANGEAALGLYNLVQQAGATCVGVGIVVEKSFQSGKQRLLDAGLDVTSLCEIAALDNGKVTLVGEGEL